MVRPGRIVRDNGTVVTVVIGVELSETCATNVAVPAVVGVPEIVPFGAKVRPGGSEPDAMLQEYGVVPPDAAKLCVYCEPTSPDGRDVVVAERAGTSETVACAVAVPVLLLAVSVYVVVALGWIIREPLIPTDPRPLSMVIDVALITFQVSCAGAPAGIAVGFAVKVIVGSG
jgi:hypothetical protein